MAAPLEPERPGSADPARKPVELPADAKRVARTIARHVEKARALVS